MEEIWLPIQGFEGYYEISNLGRVKSLSRLSWNGKVFFTLKEKILRPRKDGIGYCKVSLYEDHHYIDKKIHCLVAIYFIPNPENKPEVNHIDGNKLNNCVENLEWVTPKENIRHAHIMGLMHSNVLKGENHYFSKLTEKQVLQIRELYIPKVMSAGKLAKLFNISKSTIKDILKRRSWIHI